MEHLRRVRVRFFLPSLLLMAVFLLVKACDTHFLQIAMKFDLHSPACFLEIHEEDLAQQLSMCDYEFFKPILVSPFRM
jgi:hypothetical protein